MLTAALRDSCRVVTPPASDEVREPDFDKVICPNCVHQFRAIPVNLQTQIFDLLRAADEMYRISERKQVAWIAYAEARKAFP